MTLRPCESSPVCVFVAEFKVESTHEDHRRRCSEVFQRMSEVSPELGLTEEDCPFAVAQAWTTTQMSPELKEIGIAAQED